MSFARYPEYKDSGVEWLGQVPGHWDVVQFKQFVNIQNGSDHKHVEQADGYPVLGSGGVFTYASDFLYDGESVLLGRKGTIDKPLHITGRFWTVDTMYWTKISPAASGRFTYYSALTIPFDYYSTNTALPSMTKGALSSHSVARPPLPEQTQIAAFLDRETAKIDALVAEQRQLMALLKEKRQAVISHAVTRGLNPDAPMKPSGIEWLGDVPAHWSSPKLKTLAIDRPAAFTNGPFGSDLLTSELQDEGVPVIYIRDLKVGGYRRRSTSYVTSDKAIQLDKFRVDANDILIAKVGDPPGFCCIYPEGEPSGIICQDVIRLKPNSERVSSGYLCHLLNSQPGMEAIDSICIQLTRKRFSLADFHSLRLLMPPLSEQTKILTYIDKSAAEFDTLTTEAQRAIDLLQERRTALISAAVTGQIDVRQA